MLSKRFRSKTPARSQNERLARDKPLTTLQLLTIVDSAINSCELIIKWTEGVSEDEFMEDEMLASATAAHMINIGNMTDKMPPDMLERSIYLSSMYDFRCVAAHTYGGISFDKRIQWNIIENEIGEMLETLRYDREKLIRRLDSEDD